MDEHGSVRVGLSAQTIASLALALEAGGCETVSLAGPLQKITQRQTGNDQMISKAAFRRKHRQARNGAFEITQTNPKGERGYGEQK